MFYENNQLMKKLVVFLFIIALVIGGFSFDGLSKGVFVTEGIEKVCFVSGRQYDDFESIKCGEKFFNYCSYEKAKENLNLVKECDAVQFYADEANLDDVLSKIHFQKLYSETIEGIEICYGYSPNFQTSILLDGKKVNVQIAEKDRQVVIGFPMILTGY